MLMTSLHNSSQWTTDHVAAISRSTIQEIAPINPVERLLAEHYLWDMWPVQLADGKTAEICGGTLWMILSSSICEDPEARHGMARIRLLHEQSTNGAWRDLGNLLPDGHNPGSREWAGSAILDSASGMLTLYYTVTGHAGEAVLSFGQRLFQTTATLDTSTSTPVLKHWTSPAECAPNCGTYYMLINEVEGAPGKIKAFRDPAWIRDPAGNDYLLFAASMPNGTAFNGAIGIAVRDPTAQSGWQLLPPLLSADGLNNELERPHIIYRDGHYYLFWSTHDFTFAEGVAKGPSGLYGMVADHVLGPYTPLNGTGLIAANPENAARQAYSWLVLDDLRVASFVDSLDGETFIGTPAPMFSISLNGDKTKLITE
jgi:levansucrase